jgi:hypothetical protein
VGDGVIGTDDAHGAASVTLRYTPANGRGETTV